MPNWPYWWRRPWLVVVGKTAMKKDNAVVSRMVLVQGYSFLRPRQVTKTSTGATAKAIARASKWGANNAG